MISLNAIELLKISVGINYNPLSLLRSNTAYLLGQLKISRHLPIILH